MIKLEMKNCSMILIEKLQKYLPYHQAKLISMSILQVKIFPFNKKQVKFTYSPLGKAFEKRIKTIEDQGKNQISAIKEHGKQIIESNRVGKNYF